MSILKTSSAGVAIEVASTGKYVSGAGVEIEVGGKNLAHVSSAGVLAEISGRGKFVTGAGVLLEIGQRILFTTGAGVMVEITDLPVVIPYGPAVQIV